MLMPERESRRAQAELVLSGRRCSRSLDRGRLRSFGFCHRCRRSIPDQGENGAHRYGFVFADGDRNENTRSRGGDLGVDLVGGDFEKRFIGLDGIADLLEPRGDGAFGDRLAKGGHADFDARGGTR